jgi:hypothetical protein
MLKKRKTLLILLWGLSNGAFLIGISFSEKCFHLKIEQSAWDAEVQVPPGVVYPATCTECEDKISCEEVNIPQAVLSQMAQQLPCAQVVVPFPPPPPKPPTQIAVTGNGNEDLFAGAPPIIGALHVQCATEAGKTEVGAKFANIVTKSVETCLPKRVIACKSKTFVVLSNGIQVIYTLQEIDPGNVPGCGKKYQCNSESYPPLNALNFCENSSAE